QCGILWIFSWGGGRGRPSVWRCRRRVLGSTENARRNKDDGEDVPHDGSPRTFGAMLPFRSEIELRADLEQSRVEDAQRHQPRGEIVVLTRDRVRVQGVVEIEVDGGLRRTKLEELRKTKIELVEALAVDRSWRDDIDRGIRRSAREEPPE